MLLLKRIDTKRNQEVALIVSNREVKENLPYKVISYKTHVARDILTQVFHFDKTVISVDQIDYEVIKTKSNFEDRYCSGLGNILADINIKPRGGYISSITNNRYELIDVLLYSPYTKCYECAHVTYDHEESDCFMDISIYKNFVYKYENPGLKLRICTNNSSSYSHVSLNEESLLHMYGYNVNQQDGLSKSRRQQLLAEVIDLELMSRQCEPFSVNSYQV